VVAPTLAAAAVDTTGTGTGGCPAGRYCYYSAPNFAGVEDRADEESLGKVPNGQCVAYVATVRSIDNRTFHSILGYRDDKCTEDETRIGPGIQAKNVKYNSGRMGVEILPNTVVPTRAGERREWTDVTVRATFPVHGQPLVQR